MPDLCLINPRAFDQLCQALDMLLQFGSMAVKKVGRNCLTYGVHAAWRLAVQGMMLCCLHVGSIGVTEVTIGGKVSFKTDI